MCGIAGYIGKDTIDQSRTSNTLDLMHNRGPDYRDYASFHDGNLNVFLLHSRLSIIDLDKRANQPFTIGDYTIIYNGEIYNYVELRKELEQAGVSFQTESDTEVLLQCYIRYTVKRLAYFAYYSLWRLRSLPDHESSEGPESFFRSPGLSPEITRINHASSSEVSILIASGL